MSLLFLPEFKIFGYLSLPIHIQVISIHPLFSLLSQIYLKKIIIWFKLWVWKQVKYLITSRTLRQWKLNRHINRFVQVWYQKFKRRISTYIHTHGSKLAVDNSQNATQISFLRAEFFATSHFFLVLILVQIVICCCFC